jgi:FtsP/CotA-like multicopper oxidase with cupredoxin domain
MSSQPDRRSFLRASCGVAAAFASGSVLARSARAQVGVAHGRVPVPLMLHMSAAPGSAQILAGNSTSVLRYTAQQLAGPSGAVHPIPGSHLGPLLRIARGQRVVVDVHNAIGEDHVVHWHGLDVPADQDGHPKDAFPHGGSRLYDFTVRNRAGTYWYHTHVDMRTAIQAYKGLAGVMVVSDAEERALPLPRGRFDVPLVLQDARFNSSNQLVYTPNMMDGFLGNTVLVNGRSDFVLQASTRIYRLRLVNASVARIYKLAFSDGTPIVAIGNDGGLLAAPVQLPYVTLSPGERVELWADFSGKPVGSQIELRTLPFSGAGGSQGGALDVMRVDIVQSEPETLTLPATLANIVPYQLQNAVNANNPRVFPISMQMMVGFTLNGAPFQMTGVAANEIVQRDTLELVRITNTSGMMQVAHPIHFHGRQFQIHARSVTPGGQAGWQQLVPGCVDAGWKDTVLVMPGETVDLLVRYSKHTGLFLYHCHNLAHEDDGMMRNFRIDP